MHDNLIREREGGRLPLEVRLGSQVDIVTQMTKWTRNINLTLNIGLRVCGLCFGFSGSPCFHDFSPANFHPTDPELLICFVHFRNTETKLSSIKICLGNLASRCDLAKKPKNGISCCSLSDRPSVMTWAVAPSSSVAARSNNKVLPAFP